MTEYKYKVLATAITVILIAKAISSVGQVGFNGNGFFETRTEQSDIWLHELFDNDTLVLRVPGGAIAKFADPTNPNGWGLTYEGIDSIQGKYGSDEEEAQAGALLKWQRKADAQPDYSYLDELVSFSNEFNVKVIWVANMFIAPELAIYPVQYLLDHGVNVVAVEMGNETYSQLDHNFTSYLDRMLPLKELCNSLGVDVSQVAAPTGSRSRRDHQLWNDALVSYTSGDYVTFHRYYDGREFSGLQQPIDTNLAELEFLAYDFAGEFQDMKSLFPSAKGYMVTELNTQPADLIGDTDLSKYFFDAVLAASGEFDYFCTHSGVSPDKFGVIYGTPQKRNTHYYAFLDFLTNDNPVCDTLYIPAVYDTVWTEITANNPKCENFWYWIFNFKKCKEFTVSVPVLQIVTPEDTIIDCGTLPTDCINEAGTDPDRHECKTGNDDDYLHPERFIDGNGDCYCDECGVVFDHRINTKFTDRIIPAVYEATGTWIDTDLIDFYIFLNETGEGVVFQDIFNWCEDGKPTFFNTNKEVFNTWSDFLTGKTVWTFGVQMIDRETGINIAEYWMDHVDMTLYFVGLW